MYKIIVFMYLEIHVCSYKRQTIVFMINTDNKTILLGIKLKCTVYYINLGKDTGVLCSLQCIHLYNFLQMIHTRYCCIYCNALHNQIHDNHRNIL